MQALIEQLLNDYGTYRSRTQRAHEVRSKGRPFPGFVSRTSKSGKEIAASLEKMVGFCAEHHIDARHWLYFLFRSNKWSFAPLPSQLCSLKRLPKFQTTVTAARHAPIHGYTQQLENTSRNAAVLAGTGYDINRDITPSAEALKQRYIAGGEYQRCIDQMQETLGYHPGSRVCGTCPAAQTCAQRLQSLAKFDIIALRTRTLFPLGVVTANGA